MSTSSSTRAVVLVVDDEPAVLETTAAILSEQFEVLTATNGQDALRVLSDQPVDVLCTDYNMPGMNGIDLIRQLQILRGPTSSVLVSGFREFVDQAKKGGDQFLLLVKPYAPEKLIEVVGQAARFAVVSKLISQVSPKVGNAR